jgi:hypothetical protein
MTSENNNNLIPTINDNSSINVKVIKDSMRKSTTQIIVENQHNNNNDIKTVL